MKIQVNRLMTYEEVAQENQERNGENGHENDRLRKCNRGLTDFQRRLVVRNREN